MAPQSKGPPARRPAFNAFPHHGGGPPGNWGSVPQELGYGYPPHGYGYPPPHEAMYAPPPRRGGQKGGQAAAPRGPPQMSMEQVLGRIHDSIYTPVWEAVQKIMHLEPNLEKGNLAKKIVKFMNRAASDESLMTLEWDSLCEKLVQNMCGGGYAFSLGESEWFNEIDLSPALTAAAMVLLPAAGWRVPAQQAHELISSACQAQLDKKTLEKAMWEMCENLFGDDEKVRSKMYNAISRSYEPAVETAKKDLTPQEDIVRVESFMRAWIDDAACRAWGGLHEQAEEVMTQDTLVSIFDHLLQPFGEEHEFSAIPRIFTEEIGPPPPGWDFIPTVVEDLFNKWNNPESAPPRKRRKKNSNADENEDNVFNDMNEIVDDFAEPVVAVNKEVKAKFAKKPKGKPIHNGHPQCTSGTDCVGTPEEALVQHVLVEGPGDLY